MSQEEEAIAELSVEEIREALAFHMEHIRLLHKELGKRIDQLKQD